MRDRLSEIRAMMEIHEDPLDAACRKLLEMETVLNTVHARLERLGGRKIRPPQPVSPRFHLTPDAETFDFSRLDRESGEPT